MKRYPLIMYISLSLLLTGIAASLVRAQQPVLLPEELKGVEISDSFIDSGSEEIGEIQTVTGQVVVFHEDNHRAYYASNGDALFKQDVVYTLAESRCRIKFTTADIITMGDNTRIGIESYVDSPETGEKRSVIRLLKGKAMFYMLKLFKYKNIHSAVNTPTASIGVRGTQFGTEVRPVADMKAEISPRPIYLADASGSLNGLSQAPAGGPETETIVHCFEGAVEVSSPIDPVSKMLGEGQSLDVSSVGVGTVRRTDPEVADKFKSQTKAPTPASSESDEESSGEQGESEAEASSEDIEGEEQIDEGVDTSQVQDITQNLTTKAIEERILDLDRGGYLAAMLTRIEGGEKKFQHLYISDRAQEFETDDATLKARDVLGGDPGNPLVLIGGGDVTQAAQGNTDARLLSVEVDPGTGRETITGPFVVNDVSIGLDEFMDWGYWTVPQIMTSPSGDQYAVDNRGYYVEGDSTHDDEMAALAANQVTGSYTGTAHGTYWTDSGGTDMSGVFKAHIDFAKKEISDFGLSVSGGGHNATVIEAGGSFRGNSSQFFIDPNTPGSVWQIDGKDALSTKKEAYGSVYGESGQKMGGVWKMDAPNGGGEAHATGLFEGSR
jgi:hypothetical protein